MRPPQARSRWRRPENCTRSNRHRGEYWRCTTRVRAFPWSQPFPDPGEQYYHVNTQLFNVIDGNDKAPYNLPSSVPTTPGMQGFVSDYIASFPLDDTDGGAGPKYQQYQPIMQCFKPEQVPVLTTLAEQFAVFDHWFCSVPSHTCCNRAFW